MLRRRMVRQAAPAAPAQTAAPAEPAQKATGATQDPGQGCGVGGVACGAPASLQGPAR